MNSRIRYQHGMLFHDSGNVTENGMKDKNTGLKYGSERLKLKTR